MARNVFASNREIIVGPPLACWNVKMVHFFVISFYGIAMQSSNTDKIAFPLEYFYPSIRNKEYFEPFLTNSIYTLSIGVKNIGILESQSIFECINVRIF